MFSCHKIIAAVFGYIIAQSDILRKEKYIAIGSPYYYSVLHKIFEIKFIHLSINIFLTPIIKNEEAQSRLLRFPFTSIQLIKQHYNRSRPPCPRLQRCSSIKDSQLLLSLRFNFSTITSLLE